MVSIQNGSVLSVTEAATNETQPKPARYQQPRNDDSRDPKQRDPPLLLQVAPCHPRASFLVCLSLLVMQLSTPPACLLGPIAPHSLYPHFNQGALIALVLVLHPDQTSKNHRQGRNLTGFFTKLFNTSLQPQRDRLKPWAVTSPAVL